MSGSKKSSTPQEKQQSAATDDIEFSALCDEAHGNARCDRSRVQKFLDGILDREETAYLAGDAFVKASDCLTRINLQLIQLAQLKLKKMRTVAVVPDDDENESDAVYDNIGDPYVIEDEKN